MTDPRDDRALTQEEQSARDAVRGLARPRADEAFRRRLREDFISGRIAERRGRAPGGQWSVRPWVLAPLAAAAGLVLALALNRGPDWVLASPGGEGVVVVNDRPVPLRHTDELARLVRHGGRLRLLEGASLDLVAPGMAAVSLSAGADVVLPPAPNRWWSRSVHSEVAAGDVFFATGPHFHGATLEIETGVVSAIVTGTSLAILSAPGGTCVCVMEGRVAVRPLAGGEEVMVPAGMRRIVYTGEQPVTLPILASSEHALHRLRAASADKLGH